MNKFKWLITAFFFLCAFSLSAQTAAELDVLLETQALSLAGGARIILEAANVLPQGLYGAGAENAAYEMAQSRGWTKKTPDAPLTLKDTAFLIMKAFDFRGGFMYSLFRNPRYAYREMVYRKVIQGRADPAMQVSGPRLLQITGRALSYSGEDIEYDAEVQGGVQ